MKRSRLTIGSTTLVDSVLVYETPYLIVLGHHPQIDNQSTRQANLRIDENASSVEQDATQADYRKLDVKEDHRPVVQKSRHQGVGFLDDAQLHPTCGEVRINDVQDDDDQKS